MPPFPPDTQTCRPLSPDPRLSPAEIETFVRWSNAGAPEGPRRADLTVPPRALDPDVLLDPGVEYTPAPGGRDDYRCFVVDPLLDAAGFVTALEARPGDREIVHHVLVYAVPDSATALMVAASDTAEDGPGYTCYGTAGTGAVLIGGWAPGAPPMRLPVGTGLRIEPGLPLVVQVHYHPTDEPRTDRTVVALEIAESVDHPMQVQLLVDTRLEIPARTEGVEAGISLRVSSEGYSLHGVAPHMHTLGRAIRVSVLHEGGSEECAVDIPRWDFEWQANYFFAEPIPLRGGDVIRVDCVYDNPTDSIVRFGDGTGDEMCIAFVAVAR